MATTTTKKNTSKKFPLEKSASGEYASKIYRSDAVNITESVIPTQFSRADIEFHEVDHSGASFEARVFLNNSNADENTPKTEAEGYAGSFYILGHGGCFGDVGHCEITEKRGAYDPRPSHPLTPEKKVLIATEAVKRAAQQGSEMTVTVVPIITSLTEKCDLEDVLKFDKIKLVTYD